MSETLAVLGAIYGDHYASFYHAKTLEILGAMRGDAKSLASGYVLERRI
jgi:hypothetical protein